MTASPTRPPRARRARAALVVAALTVTTGLALAAPSLAGDEQPSAAPSAALLPQADPGDGQTDQPTNDPATVAPQAAEPAPEEPTPADPAPSTEPTRDTTPDRTPDPTPTPAGTPLRTTVPVQPGAGDAPTATGSRDLRPATSAGVVRPAVSGGSAVLRPGTPAPRLDAADRDAVDGAGGSGNASIPGIASLTPTTSVGSGAEGQPGQPARPAQPGESAAASAAAAAGGSNSPLNSPISLVLLLGAITFIPAVLIMGTAFTRIVIVLGFVRSALGTNSIPPNQVLVGLALFLSLFVMAPTFSAANDQALQPYTRGEISQTVAMQRALVPFRQFMLKQVRDEDLSMFIKLAGNERPANEDDVSTTTLVPAFLLSELRTAFLIGFVIFLPFILIDLIVSAALSAMGMVMLPPVLISLPFKLLLFVAANGWALVVDSLLSSFHS